MKDVKQENKKGNQMATSKLTMQEKIEIYEFILLIQSFLKEKNT